MPIKSTLSGQHLSHSRRLSLVRRLKHGNAGVPGDSDRCKTARTQCLRRGLSDGRASGYLHSQENSCSWGESDGRNDLGGKLLLGTRIPRLRHGGGAAKTCLVCVRVMPAFCEKVTVLRVKGAPLASTVFKTVLVAVPGTDFTTTRVVALTTGA
jgi:hypothetical protein